MPSRSHRAAVARETVQILESGSYAAPDGTAVSIRDALTRSRDGSVLYRPEQFAGLGGESGRRLAGREPASTAFEVTNETTLSAAARLLAEDASRRVLALNFASAKNPGGGFLNGSQAQEESLARASGLYACVAPLRDYYDANRACGSCLYTDHLIYSPDVPVFRDDDDRLLARPYAVSFVTAPAVNAGAVHRNEPRQAHRIE